MTSTVDGRTLEQYDFNHMVSDLFVSLPAAGKHVLDLKSGEILFRQGDPTRGLFLVERGAVQLVRNGPDGEKIILHRSSAGDCFAEASISAEHYHCDAVAVCATQVIQIDKSTITAAFADAEFSRSFSCHLARQLQRHRQILEIVAIRKAEDRVYAGLLAGLLEGTVIDFAATLHLSHEATYRALRTLTQKGCIARPERGRYELMAGGR